MDTEKQKDEITALESIYNEEEFSYNNEDKLYQCNFKIFITLPEGYYFTYKDNRYPEESTEKVQISHLPPLSLYVTLPEDYPSTSPPMFSLSSVWLCYASLAKLCTKLDNLWEENKGQEILYLWVAFLQYETLQYLNIKESISMNTVYTSYKITLDKVQNFDRSIEESSKHVDEKEAKETTAKDLNNSNRSSCSYKTNKKEFQRQRFKGIENRRIDKRAFSDCPYGKNPIQVLIDYNEKRNQIEFNKSMYTCNICFTDKLGEHCFQFLPCSHIFCKSCITGYVEVKIKDGDVQDISCPEPKCTSEATPGQIKDLVSPELFAKYDSILLNVTLDTMTDIVYCPRRHCQYPVSRDPNEQMANCPVCQYAFCVYCKMVYHGIEPCKVASTEKQQLVNEYQAASNELKLIMEKRYGKNQLQKLVENTMSENWIKVNSQNCPHCRASIEKSDGCNKMTCYKCHTYFCWLCGRKLNPQEPYLHYRNPESPCFNMLYHGLILNEEEDEEYDDLMFNEIVDDDIPFFSDDEEYENDALFIDY
ncbi:PREDICTED: E3 ubiquitin-protein ligase RNF14-like [Polistes dominula]|uniref:RBR-type E3 ubiquitin transferase n=1 Tax=Polistes dominula TaxID=743375 RepID=A0ABM1J4L0_POLDO|nr:PREDICTED: E3 ubiquitin-protein ligase RNF14-like [Polistes dominula]